MAFVKGHAKVGGKQKGSTHKVTDRAKNAALDMLKMFEDTGLIASDIAALTEVERVNAYIRLLSLVTPKDINLSAETTLTIEDRLAQLSQTEC